MVIRSPLNAIKCYHDVFSRLSLATAECVGGLLSYKAEIIHSRVNLTYQIRVCRASTTLINVSLAVTYFLSIPFNLRRPVPALQKAAKMLAFSCDAFVKSQCLNSRRLYVYCRLQIMAYIVFVVLKLLRTGKIRKA